MNVADRLLNRRGTWPRWIAPSLIVVVSAVAMHWAERTFRLAHPGLPDGYRLQDWTSNWTMQTLGLEDMLPFGPRALWYDHVYPPLLDAIRYVLMLPETNAGLGPNFINVDFRLYELYAVCFGVTNAVIYLWIRDLTRNGWWALGGTALWAISPGYITIMQLLEPSPLAVMFVTTMFYLLYRFLRTRQLGYSTGFLAALLLASLTRNITQLQVIVIIGIAIVAFWFIAKRRAWWVMAANLVLFGLILVMPIKQQVMYGTWDSSTQSGYHRAGMLWIEPSEIPPIDVPQKYIDNALVFSSRFNTQETMIDNYRASAAANDLLVHHPLEAASRLIKSAQITVPKMLQPTSKYTQNYFVEVIPWRAGYDWLFSGWRYILLVLLTLATLVYLKGARGFGRLLWRYGWFIVFYGLVAAPVIWSNRYFPDRPQDGPIWTEADRLKIFLEIPFYVLLATCIWWLIRHFSDRTGGVPTPREGSRLVAVDEREEGI
ncbi:MAG: hypothetical protein GC156_11835 [Actinomycetales bacterium]|nr:hypothetical protein [Actinomycetales bacterium]